MSLELPLYFYRNLHQAPGLALDAVTPYAQGIDYLKEGGAHFLNTCDNQLKNTINAVYPILRHPRSLIISTVLFSTKYMSNLIGMGCIYQKSCYLLSGRAHRIASIENQLLLKLKKISNYCMQLNTSYMPWQKIPELQVLEELKEELLNSQYFDKPDIEKITKAIFSCDEIYALVVLHRSINNTEDLNPEEICAIEENTDTILSAIEENTGEVLGSYTPSLLAPILNDILNSIPELYNPFTLVSHSLMTTLKKSSIAIGSSSLLTLTSSNYFVSSNAQKTILQLSAISGMSAIGLYYQDHPIMQKAEESVKEILQTFFEIACAYAGMLLFKTDESFKDYFYKIVPATAASKAIEYYLDSTESSYITSFALPLLVSSLVYNQASIQESIHQLKTLSIHVLNGEIKKQLLKPIASLITDHVINRSLNKLSQIAFMRTIKQICASELEVLVYDDLSMNPHSLTQQIDQQALQILNLFFDKSLVLIKEYFTILQQDDVQALLLKIQQKLNESPLERESDLAVEELKNQLLRDVFLKKTGTPLPLDNSTLDLLKKSSSVDIQASLFTSFKNAHPAIRMLWNSYSYDKKVDQTLLLELLLQGLIIIGLADLVLESNTAELPPFSYLKTAGLGISLAL
ncbi:MAG: hypothetical protein QG627_650 [Chlamydiota bacterium]|nr:hypothetical protein [Chlamydiota bacterium]